MGEDISCKRSDRRSGIDRRQMTFSLHIPERRSGNERRAPDGLKDESKTSSKNPTGEQDESKPDEK